MSRNKVEAYIEIEGEPLCVSEGHPGGLMYDLQVVYRGVSERVMCGHESLAEAHRTKKEIQKHRHSVRVVRGKCPESYAASRKEDGELDKIADLLTKRGVGFERNYKIDERKDKTLQPLLDKLGEGAT